MERRTDSTDLNNINAVTRDGYTGQTALGSMGLNHMNGRVEDAITGRFLSADPHITDPTNPQNFNRYSYVLNSPLRYTDPTGFDQGPLCTPTPDFRSGYSANTGPNGFCPPNSPNSSPDSPGTDTPGAPPDASGHGGKPPAPNSACQDAQCDGSSSVGDFLRDHVPLVGGILGGIADIIEGVGELLIGDFRAGLADIGGGLYSIGDDVVDLAGKAWALPNTTLTVLVGLAGIPFGARIQFSNNAIQFTNYPWCGFTCGAFTPGGNATIYAKDSPGRLQDGYDHKGPPVPVEFHEEGHAYQGEILGPLFLPIYLISGAFSGGPVISNSNPFEHGADAYSRGGNLWP